MADAGAASGSAPLSAADTGTEEAGSDASSLERLSRLVVAEAVNSDDSVVAVHSARLGALQLYRGDTVTVRNETHQRDTVCIVVADDSCDQGSVRAGAVVRNNLRISCGDAVTLLPVRQRRRCVGARSPGVGGRAGRAAAPLPRAPGSGALTNRPAPRRVCAPSLSAPPVH